MTSDFITSLTMNRAGDIFAGTWRGGVVRSSDQGFSWRSSSNGLGTDWIMAMATDERDALYAGMWFWGICESLDSSAHWVKKDSGITANFVQALAVNASGHIFAGTSSGIYRTTNKGSHWTLISPEWDVRVIAINSQGHIFVAAAWGDGFFRSRDNGNSWVSINNGISTFGLALLILDNEELYAGTIGGALIYHSKNGGNSWESLNSGLRGSSVHALTVDHIGHLYAGTRGGGIYRSTGRVTSVKARPESASLSFNLSQNFPNPFNAGTTMSFSIPLSSFVTLKVYNVMGEEIETLVSKHLQSGAYQIKWDAKNLTSGVYFYRLKTENFTKTHKLILLK